MIAGCGVDAGNSLEQFMSSANITSVNPSTVTARRASAKWIFHRGGPQTVPWYTEFCNGFGAQDAPFTTTADRRGSSQLCRREQIRGCKPALHNFARNRSSHTRSNAPETSEQYSPMRQPLSRPSSHESTDKAKASRNPLPMLYANCRSPNPLAIFFFVVFVYKPFEPDRVKQPKRRNCRRRKRTGNIYKILILRIVVCVVWIGWVHFTCYAL